MNAFRTPGVTIVERSTLPGAVAPVATAIPAFIGYTQDPSLANTPIRITSILEYEDLFGRSNIEDISVNVVQRETPDATVLGVDVTLQNPMPDIPVHMFHYCLRHYFDNGGGPCWIYSLGAFTDPPIAADFNNGFTAIEAVDEPTLLVFPDAVNLGANAAEPVIVNALLSCLRMQDRFTIIDVPEAQPGGQYEGTANIDEFRTLIAPTDPKALEMGSAYWPFLDTVIPWTTDDSQITINSAVSEIVPGGGVGTNISALDGQTINLDAVRLDRTAIYSAIRRFVNGLNVRLPPSAAVAGAYATSDRNRGVHRAPANIGLAQVAGPSIQANNALQDVFNVDAASGKAINVIRTFTGRGTLIWGARTLRANDLEWRYTSVKRLFIFMEESIKKATEAYVFESNDSNTWMRIRTMVEGFLDQLWRDGALQGEKPEHAYQVLIGLGVTMTPNDILNGILRFTVRVAAVRPAEFIVIYFEHQKVNI